MLPLYPAKGLTIREMGLFMTSAIRYYDLSDGHRSEILVLVADERAPKVVKMFDDEDHNQDHVFYFEKVDTSENSSQG